MHGRQIAVHYLLYSGCSTLSCTYHDRFRLNEICLVFLLTFESTIAVTSVTVKYKYERKQTSFQMYHTHEVMILA